jgi:hypothetical protein
MCIPYCGGGMEVQYSTNITLTVCVMYDYDSTEGCKTVDRMSRDFRQFTDTKSGIIFYYILLFPPP